MAIVVTDDQGRFVRETGNSTHIWLCLEFPDARQFPTFAQAARIAQRLANERGARAFVEADYGNDGPNSFPFEPIDPAAKIDRNWE